MSDQITNDAINCMRDGGREIAERAQRKWARGDYQTGPEQQREYLERWATIKTRIGELTRQLREEEK